MDSIDPNPAAGVLAPILDVDEPRTWPVDLRTLVESCACELDGTAGYVSDLHPNESALRRAHSLTGGYLVKGYHATHLLDYELEWIRTQGLRPLTRSLVEKKIHQAHRRGYFKDAERDHMLANNVFATNAFEHREGAVCLILSRRSLDEPDGLWRPLAQWGGEGIYWPQGVDFEREVLRRLGKPAIVVAGLDLSDSSAKHHIVPGLLHALLGSIMPLDDPGAEVHYIGGVPPAAIIDIWQPGTPDFDRHVNL